MIEAKSLIKEVMFSLVQEFHIQIGIKLFMSENTF